MDQAKYVRYRLELSCGRKEIIARALPSPNPHCCCQCPGQMSPPTSRLTSQKYSLSPLFPQNNRFISPTRCELCARTHPAKVRARANVSCNLPLSLFKDKAMQVTEGGVSSGTTAVLCQKTKSLAYFNFIS